MPPDWKTAYHRRATRQEGPRVGCRRLKAVPRISVEFYLSLNEPPLSIASTQREAAATAARPFHPVPERAMSLGSVAPAAIREAAQHWGAPNRAWRPGSLVQRGEHRRSAGRSSRRCRALGRARLPRRARPAPGARRTGTLMSQATLFSEDHLVVYGVLTAPPPNLANSPRWSARR